MYQSRFITCNIQLRGEHTFFHLTRVNLSNCTIGLKFQPMVLEHGAPGSNSTALGFKFGGKISLYFIDFFHFETNAY